MAQCCRSEVAVYVTAFILYFAVFICQIWRYVGAAIDPGIGIHDIGWQRAAGDTTAALHAINGVLVTFVWVIGKKTHWTLIWACAVTFITCMLVQCAITGSDMCLLAHGDIGYAQVGLDYAIMSTQVLFVTLILAYNMRWRPERSMLDPAGSGLSYAMMDDDEETGSNAGDVPLTGITSSSERH